MLAKALPLLSLLFFFSHLSFAQMEESHIDFTVSPGTIQSGTIQVSYEWLEPAQFRNKQLAVTDLPRVNALHPTSNHLVASKIAFISKKSFNELSYPSMNRPEYISKMLNSVSIRKRSNDQWFVTNKVRAYSIPFKVSFELEFQETTAAALGRAATYLKDEAAAFKGAGRERFLTLDMTDFSQLMYRNYSIVYMKEISSNETLVISTVVAGFNLDMANTFFNYPPFSSTRKTMMGNFESQILQMVKEIQK